MTPEFLYVGSTLALGVFISIVFVISLYCCMSYMCQQVRKLTVSDEENNNMPPRKHGATPRRFVEIRSNHLRQPPLGYDHPIIHRTQVPYNSRPQQMTTISVIDLRTKLSLNPKVQTEEPPPSYDELFP